MRQTFVARSFEGDRGKIQMLMAFYSVIKIISRVAGLGARALFLSFSSVLCPL